MNYALQDRDVADSEFMDTDFGRGHRNEPQINLLSSLIYHMKKILPMVARFFKF